MAYHRPYKHFKRKCAYCGNEFEVTCKRDEKQRFCNWDCYKGYLKRKELDEHYVKKTCEICGKEYFDPLSAPSDICPECAIEVDGHECSTRYTRKCHDCGRPTFNYRCHECWRKIRGTDIDPEDVLPESDETDDEEWP